jgi:hypothetical protein
VPEHSHRRFAATADDPLLDEGRAVVEELETGHEIVYLTGRPERCRKDTIEWLRRYGLPEARLVAVLVNDDPAVCAAARKAGFRVLEADWMTRPASLAGAEEESRT